MHLYTFPNHKHNNRLRNFVTNPEIPIYMGPLGAKYGSGPKNCAGPGPGPGKGANLGPTPNLGAQGSHVLWNLRTGYKIPQSIATHISICKKKHIPFIYENPHKRQSVSV